MQVTVIGDADPNAEVYAFAEEIGESLAKHDYTVVTGGRSGVMEAANKGAKQAGGISVGILPGDQLAEANAFCTVVIPTGIGHARNTTTALSGDALVAIGGGAGTLSEICFGWIHQKPVFVFDQFGGWSEKVANTSIDRRFVSKVESCSSIDDMINKLNKLFPE